MADSYVEADRPQSNFGASTSLKVDGSPVRVSYLKFQVPDHLTTAPVKVTLRFFTQTASSSPMPINVRPVADTIWYETGLTYANRPPVG